MARKLVALAAILVASILVLSCSSLTGALDRIGTDRAGKTERSSSTTAPNQQKSGGKPQILEFYANW